MAKKSRVADEQTSSTVELEDVLGDVVVGAPDESGASQVAEVALELELPPVDSPPLEDSDSTKQRRKRGPNKKRNNPSYRTRSELQETVERLKRENQTLKPDPEDLSSVKHALTATFKMLGMILGRVRGPHWSFSPDEVALLSDAWAPPLAPYLADSGVYLAWATAAGVTYAVVGPRLQQDRIKHGEEADQTEVELSPGVTLHSEGVASDAATS